jgi:hypothetical protein
LKAEFPMEVTLSGMVSFPEKFLQPLKAEYPMVVTPSGMVSGPVKAHSRNA